jgi:hypothetical protein
MLLGYGRTVAGPALTHGITRPAMNTGGAAGFMQGGSDLSLVAS